MYVLQVITSLRPNDKPSQNDKTMHDPKEIMKVNISSFYGFRIALNIY